MTATLSDLEQQNPNVRSQIQVWQRERTNNGQSPSDWEAFRQHAMAIGAPDPGQEAPQEFKQSAAEAESSAARSAAQQQTAQPQAQQPQIQQPQIQQPPLPQPQSPLPQPQIQQPSWPQPPQPQTQQPLDPALLNAIKIKADYEADKKTPTDKWLKARGMTQAELDAALKLAATAEGGR